MAVALGKRKRSSPVSKSAKRDDKDAPEGDQEAMKDLFRRHFESQFKPLAPKGNKSKSTDERDMGDLEADDDRRGDESEDAEEWTGFSSDEDRVAAVVEHVDIARGRSTDIDKRELKAFLSSKIPLQKAALAAESQQRKKGGKSQVKDDEEEDDSAMNLKNDLALQRLLSESHLLSKDKSGDLQAAGKSRHKALDLRFQALGSKDSLFARQKMPMLIRKGVVKKHSEREQKRRRDAKDAGIVLEREIRGRKAERKRDRGVDAPAVGNFKRGMLTLNRNDLKDIQSTRSHGPRKR